MVRHAGGMDTTPPLRDGDSGAGAPGAEETHSTPFDHARPPGEGAAWGGAPDGAVPPGPAWPGQAFDGQMPPGPSWSDQVPYGYSPGPAAPGAPSPYGPPPPGYGFPPAYWTPVPEAPPAEVPSTRPWPAPGHSTLHSLDRPRRRRWWTPLLTLLMGAGTYMGVVLVVSIGAGLALALSGADLAPRLDALVGENPDLLDPWFYILNFGILALMIPFAWLALRVVEGVGIGALSSVEGRLRWGLLARALALALLALSPSIITSVVSIGLDGGIPAEALSKAPLLIPILLVLVPLQASAEEYVFRGLALRTLMGWGLAPLLAAVIAVVPFTLGHIYGWKGLLDVTVFGLAMGWLIVRTRGLEAAIALHVVNNLTAAVFAALGGGNPLDDSDIPLWALAVSIAMTLAYTFVADRLWGPARTPSDHGDEGGAATRESEAAAPAAMRDAPL